MSDTRPMFSTDPKRCPVTGYLVIDGRKAAAVRCQLDAGHERPVACLDCGSLDHAEPGTPHSVILEWTDNEALRADWPEAYDPDEPIDVDVPELEPDELAAIARADYADRQTDAHREERGLDL